MKTAKDLELSLLVKEANIQQLKLKVKELEDKTERLNNIINTAIFFLNNECMYSKDLGYCDDLLCGRVQDLVNILKGENN